MFFYCVINKVSKGNNLMTNTTHNLLKNFDLLKSSNLLKDPNNQKYFGKKENMVSVEKPFTSRTFNELLRIFDTGNRVFAGQTSLELETEHYETLDRTFFVGGFKKISRVPFWMKTYSPHYGDALRTFEKDSLAGKSYVYDSEVGGSGTPSIDSYGYFKNSSQVGGRYETWFLPKEFGMTAKHQRTVHETFWDEDFQCFLWFYKKYPTK